MNSENEPGPGSSSRPNPPETKRLIYKDNPNWRGPSIQSAFFLWAPLFFLIAFLILHYFFPGAVNRLISDIYNRFATHVSPSSSPQPATTATTSAPVQTFTLQEIKEGVQDHLLQYGMVDKGTTYDWKKLEYSGPTHLDYALYAHLARGSTEYCIGTVVLDLPAHKMVVNSKLQGW